MFKKNRYDGLENNFDMNYKQLLFGVIVIGIGISLAYAFISPKANEALYGINENTRDFTKDSFEEREDAIEDAEDQREEAEEEREEAIEETGDEVIETESGATQTYTLAEVGAHKMEDDCWTAIRGQVYDVTAFFGVHPGGDKNLFRVCGIDATVAFERKHGDDKKPNNALAGFEIGVLKE